jgi:histidine triad (HIT) family protein
VTAAADCIFCKIVTGEPPSVRVDEDERIVAFLDIAPATRGHALVVPRGHTTDLLDSCGEAAWQTVFPFHVHVIPRYADDPLRLPWVPEAGDQDEIAAAGAALRGD